VQLKNSSADRRAKGIPFKSEVNTLKHREEWEWSEILSENVMTGCLNQDNLSFLGSAAAGSCQAFSTILTHPIPVLG